MKRPQPARISTDAAVQSGLHSAFAQLKIDSLPPVPERKVPTAPADPAWKMGRVVLQRQTAHRGGKTVIVVRDFATHLPASVIERVAKKLRAACGCGGTVRDRTVEVQGDQPARIRAWLESEGFEVGGVR